MSQTPTVVNSQPPPTQLDPPPSSFPLSPPPLSSQPSQPDHAPSTSDRAPSAEDEPFELNTSLLSPPSPSPSQPLAFHSAASTLLPTSKTPEPVPSSSTPPRSPREPKGKAKAESDGSDSDIEYMSGLTPTKNPLPIRSRVESSAGKKRKGLVKVEGEEIGGDVQRDLPVEGGYIGEFVVEGYTMVKGKGYCRPGSQVFLARTEPAAEKMKPQSTSTTGGQRSLKEMIKPKVDVKDNSKAPKVKPNSIIRLKNDRGFEIGKLPIKTTSWLAPLIDLHLLTVKGTVVHCDVPINRVGDTILLSLNVWLTKEAFVEIKRLPLGDKARSTFGTEGVATEEEAKLGKRKDGLKVLFEKIGLRPRRSSSISSKKLSNTALVKPKASSPIGKGKGKAKDEVGKKTEGEEGEEEEGERLDEDQLDSIYAQAQKNDQELDEMDPAKTFTLTLRPYQKQALKWMSDLELGMKSNRDASLHPLWQEYVFLPKKPAVDSNEIIDLDEWVEPQAFYYNPYSGEFSLKFPKIDHVCRGGILADSMGMGKTLMLASLIHTNRIGSLPDSTPADGAPSPTPAATRRPRRRLNLDTSFRVKKEAEDGPRSDADAEEDEGDEDERPVGGPHATLVVCPVSLMNQWQDELKRSAKKKSLNTMIYHGNTRGVGLDEALDPENVNRADVVITSYGVLASEHGKWIESLQAKKKTKSFDTISLFTYDWLRVVLDEAHNIKSRSTHVAKACYAIEAQRRWCLTGTPIQNRLEDLHSLLCFLRLEPWGTYSFFRSFITVPFQNKDPSAIDVVQFILQSCLLRREKDMTDKDGRPIVELPPKTVELAELEFNNAERKLYDELYLKTKTKFNEYSRAGAVGKNYGRIFSMLMKLRQAALHPLLVKMDNTDDLDNDEDDDRSSRSNIKELQAQFTSGGSDFKNQAFQAFVEGLKSGQHAECPVCFDETQEPALLPCGHSGCKTCLLDCIQLHGDDGFCPVCQIPVKEADIMEVQRKANKFWMDTDPDENWQLVKNDFRSSTKLDALLKRLKMLKDKEPTFKALVFSHFTSFLDLIETILERNEYRFMRLDGSMSVAARQTAVREFAESSNEPVIFLLSVKAGGVGINLTSANYVFMMDLWWNSSVESQAIDRCHRIGQTKPVHVVKFIISHTIENRIIKIQDRKTAIVNSSLGGNSVEGTANLELMFAD